VRRRRDVETSSGRVVEWSVRRRRNTTTGSKWSRFTSASGRVAKDQTRGKGEGDPVTKKAFIVFTAYQSGQEEYNSERAGGIDEDSSRRGDDPKFVGCMGTRRNQVRI
jgi:hypothetical protein